MKYHQPDSSRVGLICFCLWIMRRSTRWDTNQLCRLRRGLASAADLLSAHAGEGTGCVLRQVVAGSNGLLLRLLTLSALRLTTRLLLSILRPILQTGLTLLLPANIDRRAAETTDGVWIFTGGYIVIHHDSLPIPIHLGCDAVTFIEVGVGQCFAVRIARTVDAEAVQSVTDQLRLSRAIILDAVGQVVIMVFAVLLGMAAAGILYFVSHGVTSACVECIEDRHAGCHNADHAHANAGRCGCQLRIGWQAELNVLRLDGIGITVKVIRVILG